MPEPLSDEQLAALKAHRPAVVWQHPAEEWVTVPRLDLLALIEEVEGLRAERAEMVAVLRRVTPCFGYGHDRSSPATDRRRRVDCSDDQCRNPEHVTYVECDHLSHDIAELFERLALSVSEGGSDG